MRASARALMPCIVLRVMTKLTKPMGDIRNWATLLPKPTLSRTSSRVVPSGCPWSTKAQVNSQNAGGSSRSTGCDVLRFAVFTTRASLGRTSMTSQPPRPLASPSIGSPTARSCHSATILSVLWMPSPKRFSSQS